MKIAFRSINHYNNQNKTKTSLANNKSNNVNLLNLNDIPFAYYNKISFAGEYLNNIANPYSQKFISKLETLDSENLDLFLYHIAECPLLFLGNVPKEDLSIIRNYISSQINSSAPPSGNIKDYYTTILDYINKVVPKTIENKQTVNEDKKIIDVALNGVYPSNVLSNLYTEKEPFFIDNVPCYSIEGFLQALKVNDVDVQRSLCAMPGIEAKKEGKKYTKIWQKDQTLYWQGKPYKRDSEEYQELLRKAYASRFEQSEIFRAALKRATGYKIIHSSGYNDSQKTILTIEEFVKNILTLQEKITTD